MNVTVRLLLILATASLAMPAGALVPDDLLDLRTCRLQALSPDGTRLIYSVASYDRETGQDRTTVYSRDLDQGREQVLFAPDDQAGGFVFSPDGFQLVFTRTTDVGTEVWLMGVGGGD